MVSRIFERITAPVRGLHQAAYLLAALTLASQILALLRDRTFAHTFGAGQILDLYYAAFRMPDLVFALVSSLVSAYVIIPRITGADRESTRRLLSESATFLIGLGGLICLALCIFMPQFLKFLYPSFVSSSYHAQFILCARILLLQPILLGLSGVFASVTQVHRRFFLFALSPVLYNLGIIFGTVFLYPHFGLPGIGIGVVIGAVAYLVVHIVVVAQAGVLSRLRLPKFSLMAPVMRDSVPRSLALSINSITLLALVSIASRLGTGSVSVFTFAGNLEAVPLALIGSSYAVAAFPALSEASALKNHAEFTRILSTSARHVILWSIIVFGLVTVLRAQIVRVVLGTGAFNWNDTRLTAALLVIMVAGLIGDCLELLFSRALYAARQSWRPFMYQVATGIFTLILAFIFLSLPNSGFPAELATFLRVGNVPGTTILLLALANILGQFFLIFLSLIALRNIAPGLTRSLVRPFRDGCIAAIAGGAAAYAALALLGGVEPLTTLSAVFTQGFVAGSVGCAATAFVLYLIGNKEFFIMVHALDKLLRSGRSDALAPSAEEPIQP
jgi:putative peptidoglycan lipid II flippase